MRHLKNSSGQITMEYVLLIAVGLVAFSAVKTGLGQINPLGRAFGGTQAEDSAWARVKGMAQYGVWLERGQSLSAAKVNHPNSSKRYLSAETE